MGDQAPDEQVVAVLRHYMSRSKNAQHKEMIEQVIREGTSAHHFLEKLEQRRKSQECYRNIDLRGQVKGVCRSYLYRNRLMWMDDKSYAQFRSALEANNGVFTVGAYESIVSAPHVSRQAAKKAVPSRRKAAGDAGAHGAAGDGGATFDDAGYDPLDKFRHEAEAPEVISLGYYRERRERRVEYVMDVQVTIDDGNYAFKTSNLSLSGLAVYTREIVPVEQGQVIQVAFTQLDEASGNCFQGMDYKVLRISHEQHGVQLHLLRMQADARLERDLTQVIERVAEKHGEDLSDERMTAMAMICERVYTVSSSLVPMFLSRDQEGALRVEGIGRSERNGHILDLFVTRHGWTDLEGLTRPSRLSRFIEIVDAGGQPDVMLAAYRDKETQRMVVAADFEFASKDEWLRFVSLARHRADFRAFKLLIKPIRCPSCEKLTDFVDSVMNHSLSEAEDVIHTAFRTIGVAALVELTEEMLHMLQCRPINADARVIPDGDVRPLDPHAIAHNPEIACFGSLEQRRESRFKVRTQVDIRLPEYQCEGRTRNLSVGGMCVEVSELDTARIKKHDTVRIGLTTLAKKADRQDLTDIPYRVMRVERNHEGNFILCAQRLPEALPEVDAFLENLIEINRHKLEKDISETISIAKTRLFEAMAAGSTATIPMFIMRDEEGNLRLRKVAPPRQAGTMTDFFEVSPGEYDFSALAVPGRIVSLYGKCQADKPWMMKVYLYKEQVGPAQFEILSATDEDFATTGERRAFVARALEHEHLFVGMLASRAVELPGVEIDKMIDRLREKSPYRALQLRKEMSTIVAVADLIDLTREVAESVMGETCEPGE